jgi:hypothetical protein
MVWVNETLKHVKDLLLKIIYTVLEIKIFTLSNEREFPVLLGKIMLFSPLLFRVDGRALKTAVLPAVVLLLPTKQN